MIPAHIWDTVHVVDGVILRQIGAAAEGRMDQEFVRVLKAFYPEHDPGEWTCTEYNELDPERDLETKKCLCGKVITLICTIQHTDGKMFQVGSECIKKRYAECYTEMMVLKREFRKKKKDAVLEAERNKCDKCRKDITEARVKYPKATCCYPCADRCVKCNKVVTGGYTRCYTCAHSKKA